MGSLTQLADVRGKLNNGEKGIAAVEAPQEVNTSPVKGKTFYDETGSIDTTGFVTVSRVNGKAGTLMFTGLFAPALAEKPRSGVVNRRLVIDRRVDQRSPWFTKLCNDIADGDGVMQVRVKIINITKDIGFIAPCARDLDAAKREWKQEAERLATTSSKVVLREDSTKEEVALAAYQAFVEKHGGRLAYYNDHTRNAIVVSPRGGALYLLRQGENIFNFVGGILNGQTTMEKEADMAVASSALTSMRALQVAMDNPNKPSIVASFGKKPH